MPLVCRWYAAGKKQPAFSSNAEPSDGPVLVIQKALAKLYGCYEHLNVGRVGAALEDLTGGVSDKIYLRDDIVGANGVNKQPHLQVSCASSSDESTLAPLATGVQRLISTSDAARSVCVPACVRSLTCLNSAHWLC
eukprot:472151-Pleurochrysis_carterae.AAC.5